MANTIILPFSEIQAELNDEAMIDPNAVIDITENGLYNVAKYGYANVNVEGGGETWETVFEGSVTTEVDGQISAGIIQTNISADTIKVTFNGTEYTCNRTGTHPDEMYRYGAPYSYDNDEYDFSEYPFCIEEGLAQGTWSLITPTAGTYTLKIEEPQSGGSSDFSTAEVTFENVDITTNPYYVSVSAIKDNVIKMDGGNVLLPITITVPLYKGTNILPVTCMINTDESYMPTTEGSVEFSIESMGFVVTGDGTIKAKGVAGGGA